MESPLVYLLIGTLTCFIGTIPFGPINLAVVKTTVDFNYSRGMEIALAASLVEIVQALIAISFGMLISDFLDTNTLFKLVIAAIFIVLAVVVFTRKSNSSLQNSEPQTTGFFGRGLLIAALNPQAIPFWIFALAAISQYANFVYSGINLAAFLVGVFIGKLLALLGFVYTSNYLKGHLQQSSQLVNHLLAGVLLFIGITQMWNAV